MDKILVATDFTAQAEYLPEHVADLRKAGIKEVVLVNVVEEGNLNAEARDRGLAQFEDWQSLLEGQGFKVGISLRLGKPAEEIQAAAAEEKADFIVIASRGKQYIRKALIGSTSLALASIATVPVLIEKGESLPPAGEEPAHFRKIMVPTDFSLASLEALDLLKTMREYIGEVLFVNIIDNKKWQHQGAEEAAARARMSLGELVEEMGGFGIKASYLLGEGVASKEIVEIAKENGISMVILPKTDGSLVKNLILGSTAQAILLGVDIPVMMVPADLSR